MTTRFRPYQLAAQAAVREAWASRQPEDPHPMVVLATGCHPAGQRLLTFNGDFIAVEKVQLYDTLMGPDSKRRMVTRTFRFRDRVFEIRPTKGKPWRVNLDHVLTLVRTPRAADPQFPSLTGGQVVDVSVREWLTWPKWKKHVHKLFRVPVAFAPVPERLVPPYVLGVLLGDGSFRNRSVSFTSVDPEIVAEMERFAADHHIQLKRYDEGGRAPTYHLTASTFRGLNVVLNYVRNSELDQLKAGSKRIPFHYKVGSADQRREILAGLLDTDGSLSAGGVFDYISKSEELAEDVAFIARSLGLAAYIRPCEKFAQTGGGGTYYRVCISGDLSVIPCRVTRKQAAPRTQKKDVLRTGFEVVDLGYEDEFYGFTLDGDHRYLLDDFTVTHNCGKTFTALGLVVETIQAHLDAGGRVFWLAHREELLNQPHAAVCYGWPALGKMAGIVQADRDQADRRIVFASFPTLAIGAGRLDRLLSFGPPTLVVVDEAHHSVSRTHDAVLTRLLQHGAHALALTATPDRDDGADLSDRWSIVYSYGILDAIREGWLVRPYASVRRLPELDLTKVSGRRDYDDAELGEALLAAHVVEHTVAAVLDAHKALGLPDRTDERVLTTQGRGGLVFTATVEQAEQTAAALTAAGVTAAAISGETPKELRARLIRQLDEGVVQVLVNCAVLTEGTDIPRVSFLILARPTKSWSLFVQMVGRGLRLYCPAFAGNDPRLNALHPDYTAAGGKQECLVIDLAGATEEHSLVAAAVLLGRSRCEHAPNGAHSFQRAPRDATAGICEWCGQRVTCILAALEGHPGGHVFVPGPRCRFCDKKQCAESPSERHEWVPDYEAERPCRSCMYCDATVPDPLGSLVVKKPAADAKPTADAAWWNLRELVPQTMAVNLVDHGVLFVVQVDGGFRPYWVPRRGRRARAITPGPIPGPEVRPMVDDLVRKAARIAWKKETLFGDSSPGQRELLTDRAVALGLARRRAGAQAAK